jgi:two-component system, chemotaxis family, CheB/CheR fusion protein
VNLEVTPLGRAENRHFLIQFEDHAPQAKKGSRSPSRQKPGTRAATASAVERLEDELSSTRQDLQAMIQDLEAANEELQSANEEILSSNEELQSTNEELDTAREELQSTNEELSTVNDELEGRNTQLMELNGDLVNLLASVQIPIVMVSADLKIRRFTPAAERALNLIPSDIGRPIGHIKPNVRCPDLEAIIRDVVDTVTVREREVSDADGNTFVLRVRPYKTLDNRIDGAVLTLFDLSTALRLARETGEALMTRLPEPALLIDGRLIVQRVNPAFYERFGGSSAKVDGQPLFEIDGGRFDVAGLRNLVGKELPIRKVIEGYAFTAESKRLGRQHFLLDARYVEADRLGLILLVLRGP